MNATKTSKPATPLPWVCEQQDAKLAMPGCDKLCGVYVHKSQYVIEQVAENIYDVDAAYIVAACNAYPQLLAERAELVEALKRIDALCERTTFDCDPPVNFVAEAQDVARIALSRLTNA